ncbi:uncharacterized protein LOC131149893 isoform X1 [Malania oleifera]|uniref:uncharacterized protein LOC131149893 isoform X1 n=1 Tax=Malania oleifera TaxID=397392 RepID=UPI0025AEAFA7|nr:uncharacterized protein LOC131149893 isoform X1 [Malania oleifera]
MSEPPFVPRERVLEKQKYYQSIQKHTYLKGPYDKITSVAIPFALAATSLFLIVSLCSTHSFPGHASKREEKYKIFPAILVTWLLCICLCPGTRNL